MWKHVMPPAPFPPTNAKKKKNDLLSVKELRSKNRREVGRVREEASGRSWYSFTYLYNEVTGAQCLVNKLMQSVEES